MEKLPEDYFDALGEPKPGQPFSVVDDYRFHLAYRYLEPGSVLDVGVYLADFLKLAQNDGRVIYGTDVNEKRVQLANRILNTDAVTLDFRNGKLGAFEDNSVDNVVCTEVIEHVPDHRLAVSELCRVARKRVIITVPYREDIKKVLCVHCCNYTPHSGHLHSYDLKTFCGLLSDEWKVAGQKAFGKPLTRKLAPRLNIPRSSWGVSIVKTLDLLMPGVGCWLIVVLTPAVSSRVDG